MNRLLQWRKIIFRICLGCFLIGTIYLTQASDRSPVSARSDLNLKSDIISLQARISRLEQEVNRLKNSNSRPNPRPTRTNQSTPPSPTRVNPPIVDGRAIGASDPFYERLATLVIELKEDVKSIDRRLSKIEEQTTP